MRAALSLPDMNVGVSRANITMKIPTEHEEQVMLIKWFDLQYPELRGRLAACPNGGQRNVIVAAKLKAEGVRPGYPDLNLLVPRHGFSGLFIELKRQKGGNLTAEQADWLEAGFGC